jgi:hypothetical protein
MRSCEIFFGDKKNQQEFAQKIEKGVKKKHRKRGHEKGSSLPLAFGQFLLYPFQVFL